MTPASEIGIMCLNLSKVNVSVVSMRRLAYSLVAALALLAVLSPSASAQPGRDVPPPAPPTPREASNQIDVDFDIEDLRVLSGETGVALETLQANEERIEQFKEAIAGLRSAHGSEVAQVMVPDLITGKGGMVWLVGAPSRRALEHAQGLGVEVKVGAVLNEQEQRNIGPTVVDSLPPGIDWTSIDPSPEGVSIAVVGVENAIARIQDQINKRLEAGRSAKGLERALERVDGALLTVVNATEDHRGVPTNTTNGGGELWYTNASCTAAFTTAAPGGDSQTLSTAAHCYNPGQFVWEYNPELGQWHLYTVHMSSLGSTSWGDIAILEPVPQYTLDSWYGTNSQLEGDPEPYFYAHYTYGKRPVYSAGDRELNEYTCYVGRSNLTRTCGHRIIAQNRWVNDGQNSFGNMTFTLTGGNMVVEGSSGAAVSFNNEAIGIIYGRAVTSSYMNGYAPGTAVNIYSPVDGINGFTWTHQVCTTFNQYCHGTAY